MSSDACKIMNNLVSMIRTLIDPDNKALKMMPMLRRPDRNLRTFCLPSVDYTDKTSWYQKSIRVEDVVLTHDSSGDHFESFVVPDGMSPIINILHKNLTYPYIYYRDYTDGSVSLGGLPMADGSYKMHSEFAVIIKINGSPITNPAKLSIDFQTGKITIIDTVIDLENDVVTASFNYVNPSLGSEFIIRPRNSDYTWDLKHTEIQVSKSCQTPMPTIMFEIWAGSPGFIYDFSNPAGGLAYQIAYRGPADYMNIGNEGKGEIPGFGGYGDVLVFPFLYSAAIQLGKTPSSEGVLIRTYTVNDQLVQGAEIASIAYYIEEYPWNNLVY